MRSTVVSLCVTYLCAVVQGQVVSLVNAVQEAEEQHNNDMSGLQRLQVPLL